MEPILPFCNHKNQKIVQKDRPLISEAFLIDLSHDWHILDPEKGFDFSFYEQPLGGFGQPFDQGDHTLVIQDHIDLEGSDYDFVPVPYTVLGDVQLADVLFLQNPVSDQWHRPMIHSDPV